MSKIVICGSLIFTENFANLKNELKSLGFEVIIPLTSQKILSGELTFDFIKNLKEKGGFKEWVIKNDAIRKYYQEILKADLVLIANYEKNGIKNYIGGNSFLEIGFAHVNRKKIYLLNNFPNSQEISEDVEMMGAIPLYGDLSNLKDE